MFGISICRTRTRAINYASLGLVWCATLLTTVRAHATDPSEEPTEERSHETTETPRQVATEQCVDAHALAQELKQRGQLVESRAQLLRCSRDACPELVRSECLRMIDDLRGQIPSAVLRITIDGESTVDVAVEMDGKPLFSQVPTRAFDLNPGQHHFVFYHGHLAPIEREVTITDAEKLVPIAVHFVTPRPPPPPPLPVELPTETRRSIPWSVYALAGVGVVGLGGFVGFGLATRSKESELRSSCSPGCSEADIATVEKRATVADISLGVGVAALAAATATYFLTGSRSSAHKTGVLIQTKLMQPQLRLEF